MFKISKDNKILLTKGDNAEMEIYIVDDNDNEYKLDLLLQLTIPLKKSISARNYIFEKTYQGTNIINFIPADTKTLACGNYYYDIQLTTVTGEIYTIVPPSIFCICEEVTTE